MIDGDLLRRARDGDPTAVSALLAAHRNALLEMVRGRLSPQLHTRIDASDIVQQTCLSVFRQITEFAGQEPAQFAEWIRQIHERNIKNAIHSHVGVQKRSLNNQILLGSHDPTDEAQVTASDHAIQTEEATLLSKALETLPTDERLVLELRFFEGWTLAQIADYIGMTKEAVVWRLQKGMRQVRSALRSGTAE